MKKHSHHIRKLAEKYAASKGLKLSHEAAPLNEERSGKIAQAFEELKHEPENPEVKEAYKALIDETISQYQLLKKSGLKVTPIGPDMKNPYKDSAAMIKDVRDNNHIYFYPTDLGFGSKDNKTSNHPLLQPTKEKAGEHKMVANDIFRVVHDYFGHAKEGVSFGPKGEEAAWQHHMQMYSLAAQKALTTETRGQNSWVNFGPQGEANRANPQNTQYAEQKAGLLPDWAMETDQAEKPKFAEGGDVQPEEHEITEKALTGQPQQSQVMENPVLESQNQVSIDPDLLRQVQRLAGSNHLKQLFDSGLLEHKEVPAHEKVAVISASGKPHVSRNSPLRKFSSNKLEANLGKFLEKLGNSPPVTDEKGLDKLKLKAKQMISLMPGMRGVGADETEDITNTILKAATNGELNDLQDIVDHEVSHARNNKRLNEKVEGLFGDNYSHEEAVSPKEHDDIHKYIEDNGLANDINAHKETPEPEKMAKGGEVTSAPVKDRVADLFPEQAALMNAHKARAYAYLNSVKPSKIKALPFDTEHKSVLGEEPYKQALGFAARPLSILDHVRNGTVSPHALKSFVSLHPELYDVLKQKLSDNMVKQQIDGKRPNFKTRQSMSIFMGAPLESSLTPQSIQAAQATFTPKAGLNSPQQPMPGSKGKKGTSTLGKSNKQYRTLEQSAEADRGSRD